MACEEQRMGTKGKARWGAIGIAAAVLMGVGGAVAPAIAEETTPSPPSTEQFEAAFFSNDRPFYSNQEFPRTATWLFGLQFPELEIAQDAEAVNELYREGLAQQSMSGPLLRSDDLANPYTDSLLTTPIYTPEAIPAAPTASRRSAPPSSAPAARSNQPTIRGMW
jgi:hypothetical protein